MKNLKIKKIAFFISALCIIFFSLCLIGCSKNQTPTPPQLKIQLVSELFASLKQEKWDTAMSIIQRINEISPNESALGGIRIIVENNITMRKAQDLLNKGDIDGAILTINQYTSAHGQTIDFRNAITELNTLKEIQKLAMSISVDNSSNNKLVVRDSTKLGTLITNFENAQNKNTPESRIEQNRKFAEISLGLNDLRADIDTAWVKNSRNIDTLMAILDAADPSDKMVKTYKEMMAPNWQNNNSMNDYLDTSIDLLPYRTVLLNYINNPSSEEQNINKLTSLKPSNFRTEFADAILLNLKGDKKNSITMLNDLKQTLRIPDDKFEGLFNLAIQENQNFSSLSSFVLFPTYIYIPTYANIVPKEN